MKLGIAQRIALILALFGILAAAVTGYYANNASRELLLRAAEERLLTSTRVLVRQIEVSLDKGRQDVLLLAGHPSATAALTARSTTERQQAEDTLASIFTAMLRTQENIYQLRLISTADNGKERVRVDRDNDSLLRVDGDDLQEKGHFPYVYDTLDLPDGTVYISNPVINHERGAHSGEGRPSIHLATPIRDANGTPLGLIVLNAGVTEVFRQLSRDIPADIHLYLSNSSGDFLIHPDRTQAFAFDRGRRALMQDQFPATRAILAGHDDRVIAKAPDMGTVAAFVRYRLAPPQDDLFFVLGLSEPTETILKESDAVGAEILRIVVAFSVFSIILAALLARAVTGPLAQMVRAVQRFAAVQERVPLPTDRQDEIGVLARSFDDMQQRIETQVNALHAKQRALDHLASHDALTGLPNRRIFLERVDRAMARARRNERPFAILFIDIDHFKQINDRFGHAVGDLVLTEVGERLRNSIRETDTLARLGGDEFIALIDEVTRIDDATTVAQKIIAALAAPVIDEGRAISIGTSIGLAIYPQHGQSTTELIAAADQAMYRAKTEGRNRYCLASNDESATPTSTTENLPLDL